MPYKFEVYKDSKGEFRSSFQAPNGENMFASEVYKQEKSAMNALDSIKKNAFSAEINEHCQL